MTHSVGGGISRLDSIESSLSQSTDSVRSSSSDSSSLSRLSSSAVWPARLSVPGKREFLPYPLIAAFVRSELTVLTQRARRAQLQNTHRLPPIRKGDLTGLQAETVVDLRLAQTDGPAETSFVLVYDDRVP